MTAYTAKTWIWAAFLMLGLSPLLAAQEVAESAPAPTTEPAPDPDDAAPPASAPAADGSRGEAIFSDASAATQPAAGATPVPEETTAIGLTMPDGRIMLNFRNASLDAVLSFLSEATGVVVVSDVSVTGRVSVISRQPVTMDEALEVLSSVLKQQGYASVRTGKTLKIMTLDAAKKANIPVRSGSDPQKVDDSDQVLTQVIPVRYANAVQLKADLAPLIPAYADLSANASTNTLIMTDTASNVRRVLEIIHALDTAVSAVTQVKVFTLKYANAINAARLITEIFQPPEQQQQQNRGANTPFFARFGRGPGGQAGAPTGPTEAGEGRPQTKVIAAADDRTNTIVVSAPGDTMPLIDQVLKELDANPAQDQAVFIYYFRNASASNAESVVNNLFNTTATGAQSTANRGTTARTTGGTTSSRTGGTTSRTGMGLSRIGSTSRTTGTTAARATTAAPRVSSAAAQTAAELAGQVRVVADLDTNSLLVMTGSGNFERVKEILAELDRAVPQVLIKVLIAEVTHDNDIDLGVEFSAINLKAQTGKDAVFTDFGLAAATGGGLVARVVDADFTVTLRALEKVGKLDVLSRPYILTSDNQQASIIVGQEIPIIVNSRITDQGQTINTLQYQDVGIILNVTPHVNLDGLVVMDVAPEISSLTGDTVPISDTASQPIIAKRAAQTRVAIQNGQTIVIGGLMEDRKTQNDSKVPILGDIPLIGQLFRRDHRVKSKTELLIFLTPHVAQVPAQLQGMSDDERNGAKITPEAVAPGVFEEHMKGLQRGGAVPQDEQPKREDVVP